MFRITQTNTTVVEWNAVNPRSGDTERKAVTHMAGRIIAEHATRETTEKHAEKLRKRHPEVAFCVVEIN